MRQLHHKGRRSLIKGVFISLTTALFALLAVGQDKGKAGANQETKPSITITVIPPRDKGGPDKLDEIAGTVSGVKGEGYKVVLYAFGGDRWWVQPFEDSRETPIGADGKWRNDTHLGPEYAALLVRSSYQPQAKIGRLPSPSEEVLAVARVQGKAPEK